jgi:peptidoglycan/LPS O-acetylase OafA/YrhL
MNTPRGYNPVGESAPGLPRHDAPLPGHVPGQYTPIGGGDEWSSSVGGNNWSPSVGYRDPGFSPAFGIWSGRIIMVCAIYLTLPIQLGLYPIAGAVGLAAGAAAYVTLNGSGMDYNAVLDWTWTACFAGLVAAMRVETGIEDRVPGYRIFRHVLRLALVAGAMYYDDVYHQMDPPKTAAIVALVTAVLVHFILRARLLKGIWQGLQAMLWLRAN